MSGHVEVECWVDREHFESEALAAAALGISASILSRKRRTCMSFQVLDEFDRLHIVDFIYPGPVDPSEIPPPPPPRPARRPGEPLLRGLITYRLGVYR